MFKWLDTLLDTFSDTYHCKKCDAKLGCEYCKAYGGMIVDNKYNTGDIVKEARQNFYNNQEYQEYLKLKEKYKK